MLQDLWLLSLEGKEVYHHATQSSKSNPPNPLLEHFLMGLKTFTEDMGSKEYILDGDNTILIGKIIGLTQQQEYYLVGKFESSKKNKKKDLITALNKFEKKMKETHIDFNDSKNIFSLVNKIFTK
jgi:hypothetical protein